MLIKRRFTRTVKIGGCSIGGNNPIAVQSMAKTATSDIAASLSQIKRLQAAGCQIVRLAVKDAQDVRAIKEIKKKITIPIVADIHFNWRLAIEAIESGVDKIRLNPGNIYKQKELAAVISALKAAQIPLRVGVNSGSLPDSASRNKSLGQNLAAGALAYVRRIEKMHFSDIVISLKGSGVLDTIEAYRYIAKICDYPLHLGVTACGLPQAGTVKTSIACGILLSEGIGDTLRVSLTGQPLQEVRVAKAILESLGLRSFGHQIISCPSCGRCEVDLMSVVNDLESKLSTIPASPAGGRHPPSTRPQKVAIMGCVVNGPGEAKQADIGVAFGKKEGLLFKNGKAFKKVSISRCADILLEEIKKANV